MKQTLLILLFSLTTVDRAFASAACCGGDGSFGDVFAELVQKDFHAPLRPTGERRAYVIRSDGERHWLDNQVWTTARRMAAAVDVPPVPELTGEATADVSRTRLVEWTRALGVRTRMLALEASATVLDAFFRFGTSAAVLVAGAEGIEHYVLPVGVPLCKFVQTACVLISGEMQDLRRAMFTGYPGVKSMGERLALLRLSKQVRRTRKQALRLVFHADGRDVEVDAENQAPGAGLIARSCFQSALATPDHAGIACTEDHATGLRYPGFGGKKAPRVRPKAEAITVPDLVGDMLTGDVTERLWTAHDVIDFLHLKLSMAQAQVYDVGLKDARSFYRLRRRVTAMRKAVDQYAYMIQMRAGLGRPRTVEEAEVDRGFDRTLKTFLIEFDRGVKLALIGLGAEPHPFEGLFKSAPKKAFQLVRDWLRHSPVGDGITSPCADNLEI